MRTLVSWQVRHLGMALRRSSTYRLRAGIAVTFLAAAALAGTGHTTAVGDDLTGRILVAALLGVSGLALLWQRPPLFALMAAAAGDGFVTVTLTDATIVKTAKPSHNAEVLMRGRGTGTAVTPAGARSFPVPRSRVWFDVDCAGSRTAGRAAFRLYHWQDHAQRLTARLTLAQPAGQLRVLAVELEDGHNDPLRLSAAAPNTV